MIIVIIILVLLLIGALPQLGYHDYGYVPSGGAGVLIIILLILLLMGRF